MADYEEIMAYLKEQANPRNVEGMARFGINTHDTYGISVTELRHFAKGIGKNHDLAAQLWASEIHEARILAALIDLAPMVTEDQMERWVADFDSWDVCDQVCSSLFDKTSFAWQKAFEWSEREEEFVKRAGFVLMAALAVHDKAAGDDRFEGFFPAIEREAGDGRNFVKKAVNWALRQIGKRNSHLRDAACAAAEEIGRIDSKPAKWIASDALRELRNPKTYLKRRQEA